MIVVIIKKNEFILKLNHIPESNSAERRRLNELAKLEGNFQKKKESHVTKYLTQLTEIFKEII